MASPTPDQLVDHLEGKFLRLAAEVGIFADVLGGDGRTRAFEDGLRAGLEDVGVAPALPFGPLDPADVAQLSAFAVRRVLQRAEWAVLDWILLNWPAIAARAGQPEYAGLAASEMQGGWRAEQRRIVEAARDALAAKLAAPYREPGPAIVVNEPAASTPWSGPYFARRGCW